MSSRRRFSVRIPTRLECKAVGQVLISRSGLGGKADARIACWLELRDGTIVFWIFSLLWSVLLRFVDNRGSCEKKRISPRLDRVRKFMDYDALLLPLAGAVLRYQVNWRHC